MKEVGTDNIVMTTSAIMPSACVNVTTPPPTQTAETGSVARFFVEVTNSPELYFDVTMFRQPTRLYRLVAVP
jgi:hypothetical protein